MTSLSDSIKFYRHICLVTNNVWYIRNQMDRTSILGDTIDYMRELLDKIHKLREEGIDENTNGINLMGKYLKELKPNETLVRNPPKVYILPTFINISVLQSNLNQLYGKYNILA